MNWVRIILTIPIFLLHYNSINAQDSMTVKKHRVYLLPGQGADYRLFSNLTLDEKFETRDVLLIRPEKNMSMKDYAYNLAKQIDTTESFSIVGVSLGGMLSVELSEKLNPHKIIIISSAKNRSELPGRYRFMKSFPINRIIPPFLYKAGSKIAQPLVEPDRKNGKDIFVRMLNDKDPKFLKRTVNMIIRWQRKDTPKGIIHIHGTNDHTLPHRNVNADYLIKDGSHMMVLTKGEEISKLVNKILQEE